MDQEVDVKLFITCRLCLDEPGSYQIVPCIKTQIYYCFGIDVDPFDGLPQLICKKCKATLSEFFDTKTTFLEKQQKLLTKVLKDDKSAVKNGTDNEFIQSDGNRSVAASDDIAPGQSVRSINAADANSRGNSVKSVCASDVASKVNSVKSSNLADIASHSNSKTRKASWKKAYNKHFVCTICNKTYVTEKSVKKHATTHKKLISKHEKIFRNYITVRLNKIDKKRNSTGCLQNVVYSKDKIISDRGNSNYYSYYLKKAKETKSDFDSKNQNEAVKRPEVFSDDSDDEIVKGKKRKSCRLLSNSSTQTVILENNNTKCHLPSDSDTAKADKQNDPDETVNPECINLDDTSSEGPGKNPKSERPKALPRRQKAKVKVSDYKAIQSIVTMCHKNYMKKGQLENDALNKSTFSESSLKHKVLSLGRKVINKQGFSCTGLLRYMEHKDLDITWTPTSNLLQNKGSNFVRIMTKLKSREDSENENAGWKNLYDISFCRDSGMEGKTLDKLATAVEAVCSGAQAPAHTSEDPLYACPPSEITDLNLKNKLLNKTPVSNPKQLPKKNSTIDMKPVTMNNNNAVTLPSAGVSGDTVDAHVEESNMCMPIITSTTSLATIGEKQEVPNVEKPRIKVKPASELMSERALNNHETADDIWAFNMRHSTLPQHVAKANVYVTAAPVAEAQGIYATGILSPVTYQHDAPSLLDETNRSDEKNHNLEYVILHTTELPNEKTKSPFHYFKKLLLIHGLKLLELNDDLPLHCLIKFRLMLRQDTKRPIEVLLSLFCSKSTFCFKFKDTNSKNFDPNELPAYWQWELLKIYKGNVVDKILQNALNIGKEVHDLTQHFLCLLKSIELIKES